MSEGVVRTGPGFVDLLVAGPAIAGGKRQMRGRNGPGLGDSIRFAATTTQDTGEKKNASESDRAEAGEAGGARVERAEHHWALKW
jgi:hypothetical protein